MNREPQQWISQGRSGQPPADGLLAGQAEPGDYLDMAGIAGGSFVNIGSKESPRWQRRVTDSPLDGARNSLTRARGDI
jgi:hypothetical protein